MSWERLWWLGTHTQTCAHTQAPIITVENSEHSFRLDTKYHADGAQEERNGQRWREGTERKADRNSFCGGVGDREGMKGSVFPTSFSLTHLHILYVIVKANVFWQRVQKHHHTLIFTSIGCASVCKQDLYNLPPFKTKIQSTQKKSNRGQNWKKVDHTQSVPANHLQAQLL